jgi:methylmalonyl-CoA/ethylmalonyl-CoA epimerase
MLSERNSALAVHEPQFSRLPGSLRFHHLGIAVASLDPAIELYRKLFGYRVISEVFQDPIQRVSVCFLDRGEVGEAPLELIAPLDGDSPVKGVLIKGGGAYHICFVTTDIEGTLAAAAGQGCLLVSPPVPAIAFEGRRIAWFFTPTKQLVELVEAGNPTPEIASADKLR